MRAAAGDDDDDGLSAYERQREQNIRENNRRLRELGLLAGDDSAGPGRGGSSKDSGVDEAGCGEKTGSAEEADAPSSGRGELTTSHSASLDGIPHNLISCGSHSCATPSSGVGVSGGQAGFRDMIAKCLACRTPPDAEPPKHDGKHVPMKRGEWR